MLQTEEEYELIQKCLQGNSASQKKLFDIFSGKMYSVCMRYASDPDLAQDFLQEGFIRLFKNLHQFRFEGSFEGWVRRIFIHTSIEFCRKNAKNMEVNGLEDLENVGFDENVLDKFNAESLLLLVQKLPTGYRTVFNLYAIEGYTHKEIAIELGISENTSKTQLRKARLGLIAMLNKEKD